MNSTNPMDLSIHFMQKCNLNRVQMPLCLEILPSNNGIVQIAVLSSWDNVMGPKALCIWKQKNGNLLQKNRKCENSLSDGCEALKVKKNDGDSTSCDVDDAVKYVVGHTLHGELSKEVTQSKNFRTEIFIVPHKHFIVNAIIFGISHSSGGNVGHSFSIVCSYSSLEYFMKLQYLCDMWQQRMAAEVRVFLTMGEIGPGIERLSSMLSNFCNMLGSLELYGFHSRPMVSESYLSLRHVLERKLLERAIVSHLQTCGCSVVIGENEQSVNSMVNTLAQFIRDKDLAACRPVIKEKPLPYYSGLFLQGLLKDQYGEADISAQDVLHSPFPVTIIDIPHCKVRQSLSFHEHTIQRHKVLRQELISLMTGTESIRISSPSGSIFQTVNDRGTLVPQLLVELSTLPPTESVLQYHIQDFYKKLEYKAIAVLKYLESLRSKNQSVNMKQLQKYIGLPDTADMQIILSVAERLRPGIYSFVKNS